ncbi:hypothetical protein LEP3755_49150 [Leptolyngbya sp. NIES-3755]|nr:hypothetical protein LEP3755_49150 [Leptolyngbya sp. NIES-3755]
MILQFDRYLLCLVEFSLQICTTKLTLLNRRLKKAIEPKTF